MVERVKISPNRMVCKDASGNVKFDSARKYVYTGGNDLQFSFAGTTPQPKNSGEVLQDIGGPLAAGMSVGNPVTYIMPYDAKIQMYRAVFAIFPTVQAEGARRVKSSTPTVKVVVNGQDAVVATINYTLVFSNNQEFPSAAFLTFDGPDSVLVQKGDTVIVERFSENAYPSANPTYFVFSHAVSNNTGLGFTE